MPPWNRSLVHSKASGRTGIPIRLERRAQLSISEDIEVFYNRQLRHSTLGYLSQPRLVDQISFPIFAVMRGCSPEDSRCHLSHQLLCSGNSSPPSPQMPSLALRHSRAPGNRVWQTPLPPALCSLARIPGRFCPNLLRLYILLHETLPI